MADVAVAIPMSNRVGLSHAIKISANYRSASTYVRRRCTYILYAYGRHAPELYIYIQAAPRTQRRVISTRDALSGNGESARKCMSS